MGFFPPVHFLNSGFAMAINYRNQLTPNLICLWGSFYLLTKLGWSPVTKEKTAVFFGWDWGGGAGTPNGGGRPQTY